MEQKSRIPKSTDPLGMISPLDFRYYDKDLQILSEGNFIKTQLEVESALAQMLCDYGFYGQEIADDISQACQEVLPSDVYEEEQRIHHDVKALVNCIKAKCKLADSGRFVHFGATSYDIISTARSLFLKEAVETLLLPQLYDLLVVLVAITEKEAETVQIGRTHGQHAVPMTFGFAMSNYVIRLEENIGYINNLSDYLPGKFSGAVGAYNSLSLFLKKDGAISFEENLIEKNLCLIVAESSTQIVPPENKVRLLSEVMIAAGIMADLADDMRHLQRTEISEIGESFEKDQVGSSTMPQKKNPINFENVKGMWKILSGRMATVYADQLSEHQRDLTNSVTSRCDSEIIAYTFLMAKRLTKTMSKMGVDRKKMKENLYLQGDLILAEPLQLLLSFYGCPNAHEEVRKLSLQSREQEVPLMKLVATHPDIKSYLKKMTPEQWNAISSPENYTGLAAYKAKIIAQKMKDIMEEE